LQFDKIIFNRNHIIVIEYSKTMKYIIITLKYCPRWVITLKYISQTETWVTLKF